MSNDQPKSINKKVEYEGLTYLINEEKKTAGVIGCKSGITKVIIPKKIKYKSKKYYVTSILEEAFKDSEIDSIKFALGSKIQTINKNAFIGTFIKSITIPSKLTELKNCWCYCTPKLNKISVSPTNPYFKVYQNKFIIGKSSIEQKNYDQLIFCVRDVETVTIPDFIEHVCSCAFYRCENLIELKITENSKLQTIDDFAFTSISIQSLRIPSQIKRIGNGAFLYCKKIQHLEIPYESKLQIINELCFSNLSIKKITIPPQITHIGKLSFNECYELQQVEILRDSKLKIIDESAFFCTSIESILIPSNVEIIGDGAFSLCNKLKHIEVPSDSKLHSIGSFAFENVAIEKFEIPSKLVELKIGWCKDTKNLTKISVSSLNPYFKVYKNKFIIGKSSIEKDFFDQLIFCVRNVKKVTIPNFIEHICPYAFNSCRTERVEFTDDTKLQIIDDFAFSYSSIKCIRIPSKVTKIGECTFETCRDLRKIEIPIDSKLQLIGKFSFSCSSITSITIPSNVTKIAKSLFASCEYLLIIEFYGNFKDRIINQDAFNGTKNLLIMVGENQNH